VSFAIAISRSLLAWAAAPARVPAGLSFEHTAVGRHREHSAHFSEDADEGCLPRGVLPYRMPPRRFAVVHPEFANCGGPFTIEDVEGTGREVFREVREVDLSELRPSPDDVFAYAAFTSTVALIPALSTMSCRLSFTNPRLP